MFFKKTVITVLACFMAMGLVLFVGCGDKGSKKGGAGTSASNENSRGTAGLEFTLADDGQSYYVSGMVFPEFEYDMEIVIPSVHNKLPVTAIGQSAFLGAYQMKSISLPNSIVSIGENAFMDCQPLQTVKWGNGLQSIGDNAFKGSGVESGELPESLVSIGESAFSRTGLTEIIIPDNVLSVPDQAFSNCFSLKRAVIGEAVTEIGEKAFYDCDLESVTVGNNVKSIGREAFAGISMLDTLILGSGLESVAEEAFYSTHIYEVIFNGSVADWCNVSFSGQYSVPTYHAVNLYIGGELVADLVISGGVTEIKDWTFAYCNSLISLTLGDGVTSVGEYAFCSCRNLKSLQTANSVTDIGNGAFDNCESLSELKFGNGLKRIGDFAFTSCTSLTKAGTASATTEVGDGAFYGCTMLMSFTANSNLERIGNNAFKDCYKLIEVCDYSSSLHLQYSVGLTANGYVAYYARQVLTSIGGSKLSEENGFVVYTDETDRSKRLVGYVGNDRQIVVPNDITHINQGAFYFDTTIVSISIGRNVQEIGAHAFERCENLIEVYNGSWKDLELTLGSYNNGQVCGHAKNLYRQNFGSSKLTNENGYLVYHDTDKNIFMGYVGEETEIVVQGVDEICSYAFYGNETLTSVCIGNGVTEIGESAFSKSNIQSVSIGQDVNYIKEKAFAYCNSLISVFFEDRNGWRNSDYGSLDYVGISLDDEHANVKLVTVYYGINTIWEKETTN